MIRCPCCGSKTIDETQYVEFPECIFGEICPVCFWEYDWVGIERPDIAVGPNNVSLNQARENYKEFGACSREFVRFVRPPRDDEL